MAISKDVSATLVARPGDEEVSLVSVLRLDDAIDVKVDFLKVDAEGFEHEVLEGAERILGREQPLMMIEFTEHLLRSAGTSAVELASSIRTRGYSLAGFERRTRTLCPLEPYQLPQGNVVAIPVEQWDAVKIASAGIHAARPPACD